MSTPLPSEAAAGCHDTSTSGGLSENIRYLVSLLPSIAVASRQMAINRQQLNKYLNGSCAPSLRTMRKMAAVFDLPTEALMLSPRELRRCMARSHGTEPGFAPPEQMSREAALIRKVAAEHENSAEALAPYCGRYFRYSCVPEMPTFALRTYVIVFQRNGMTYARVLERFAPSGSPWSREGVRKTLHLLSYVQDRIQFIDCGTSEGEVTPEFSLFYPAYTSGVQHLSGVLLGSFSFGACPIFTSSIVMWRRPTGASLRDDLRFCGLVAFDDPALGAEVRHGLCRADGAPAMYLAG